MKNNYEFPYRTYEFVSDAPCEVNITESEQSLHFEVFLNETELLQIDKTEIVLEMESSSSMHRSIRKLHFTNDQYVCCSIDLELVGTIVEYSVFIVATEDGDIELNGKSEYHEKGDCLGILSSDKHLCDGDVFSSFIRVNSHGLSNIEYDLSQNDFITIKLPREVYQKYVHWQMDTENTPLIVASMAYPVIQYALFEILHNDGMNEKNWYTILETLLKRSNFLIKDLTIDLIPGAVDQMLDSCINKLIDATSSDLVEDDHTLLG